METLAKLVGTVFGLGPQRSVNSWQEILDLKDDFLHDKQLALNFFAEEVELSGLVWLRLSGLTAIDATAGGAALLLLIE